MQLHYRLTEDDWVRAVREGKVFYHWRNLLPVIYGVLVVLFGVFWIAVLNQMWLGLSFIFVGILVPTARLIAWRRLTRRTYRDANFMHGDITAEITDTGLRMTYPEGNSETRWEGFHKVMETASAFMLFVSPQMVRVLPKSAFTNEQITVFRTILVRNVHELIGVPHVR